MSGLFITCVEALPIGLPVPPWMRISLPKHDLLQEEGPRAFSSMGFIGFNLHRNTGKAHQSLPGSKDQIIKTYKELQGLFLSQGQLAKGL